MMQRYVARRVLLGVVSILGLTIVVFVFLRAIPGDTAVLILGPDSAASEEDVQALREELGLNDPLPVQYLRWLGDIARADLGKSLFTGRTVTDEVSNRIETTLELAALSLIMSLLVGVTTGTASALWRGTVQEQVIRFVSLLGLAIPNFWLGTMVVVYSARWFGWIPPVQHTSFFSDPSGNLQQFVIPAAVVGLGLAASLARLSRSAVLEVLREDYIRTARAKGLRSSAVLFRHTLRGSLIPILSLFAVQVGAVVAGTVVIENVFNLPGMGRLLLDSIGRKDYPVVQGIVLLYGSFIVMVNIVTDITYGVIDPRIRLG
ncbi:MAG: peptide ABC transporter permease [Dehalococcoidia bacterium]|nr:ABC transporter permease [Tepidiformaceae bacterium]